MYKEEEEEDTYRARTGPIPTDTTFMGFSSNSPEEDGQQHKYLSW